MRGQKKNEAKAEKLRSLGLTGPGAERSYWVRIPGHAAQVLDSHGWLIESLGPAGQVRSCPNFDQKRVNESLRMRSLQSLLPSLTGPEWLERIASEVVGDVWGSGFAVAGQQLQDALIKLVRGHLDAELRAREDDELRESPSPSGQSGSTNNELKDYAVTLGMDREPILDGLERRVDNSILSDQGGVTVDPQQSHETSPSVGAPKGAVCDNPNPTDGEPQSGAAATSPATAAPDQKTS